MQFSVLGGLLFVVSGLALVVLAGRIAEAAIRRWQQKMGHSPSRTGYRVMFTIVGVGLIAGGIVAVINGITS